MSITDPGPDEDYKKKTRRNRTTFSNSQLAALEKVNQLLSCKYATSRWLYCICIKLNIVIFAFPFAFLFGSINP
jgi:hypothetical protein